MQRGFHLSPCPLSLVVLSMNVETKSTLTSTLRCEGLIGSLVAYYVYPKCLVRGGRLILGVVVSGGTAAEQHSYLLLLLLPSLLLLNSHPLTCSAKLSLRPLLSPAGWFLTCVYVFPEPSISQSALRQQSVVLCRTTV